MRARPTLVLSIGATPVSIRKPPLISFTTQPFTAPADVGASNTITVPSTAGWTTGLACRLSIVGATMPTGLVTTALYYLIVASGRRSRRRAGLAHHFLTAPWLRIAVSGV